MKNNNCFFELPELKYDREFLSLCAQNVYRSKFSYALKYKQQVFGMTWVPMNNKEVERIRRFFSPPLNGSYLCVLEPFSETGMHTDDERGATLILPISRNLEIQCNQVGELVTSTYDVPIVTNSKSLHNAINQSDSERVNLLFHCSLPYEELYQLYINKDLFLDGEVDHVNGYNGVVIGPLLETFGRLSKRRMATDVFYKAATFPLELEKYDLFIVDSFSVIPDLREVRGNKGSRYVVILPERVSLDPLVVQEEDTLVIYADDPGHEVIDTIIWVLGQSSPIRRVHVGSGSKS